MKSMPGGMHQFLREAQQMQNKIKKLQAELAEREFEASAGGHAVRVKVKGEHTISELTIHPEVVESGDIGMLQDLIITAANEALKIAKETSREEMDKISNGLGKMF